MEWKTAHVVPVYKKGDRSTLTNYRPIALTSIVVKMLESLVCDKLRNHLLTNGLMFENQHGFSPGKSCATALCEATTEWLATLDRRSSLTARIDLISVDYSRTFDSISHDVLISKLHKTYCIRASLLQWITSFLTGRRQCVVFRGASSDWTNVLSGVPQGSVLGPLLFNIYANDLHLHLKSTIYAYADDTFIFREIKTDNDISVLQSDLDSLNWWSKNNSLQLNPSKCQVMCITRRRDKPVPSYNVNNTTLETCDSLRLLGVTVSSDLSWNCHVNNITKKCNKLLGFIRVVASVKNPYVLLKLYQTLILPILDYCSPVWNVHKNCNVEKLEQIQHRTTRMILCQRRGEQQYQDRLKTLNLTTLKTRRSYLSVSFACSCLINASLFYFCRWCVNTRQESLIFKQNVTPKTNSYKYCLFVHFPVLWSSISSSTRDALLILNKSTFKSRVKTYFMENDV